MPCEVAPRLIDAALDMGIACWTSFMAAQVQRYLYVRTFRARTEGVLQWTGPAPHTNANVAEVGERWGAAYARGLSPAGRVGRPLRAHPGDGHAAAGLSGHSPNC